MAMLMRLLRSEEGATTMEYGLLMALVTLGMLTGLRALGPSLDGLMTVAALALR